MKNNNKEIQNKYIGEIYEISKKSGIMFVALLDEDVIDRLDGDERLSKLTADQIDAIKNETIDGLMEYFTECLDNAIENNLK